MKRIPPGSQLLLDVSGIETYLHACYLEPPTLVLTPEVKTALIEEWLEGLYECRPEWRESGGPPANPNHVAEFSARFKAFLDAGEPGDTVSRFDGFPYMPPLSGRAGMVVMRGDRVVSAYVSRMS